MELIVALAVLAVAAAVVTPSVGMTADRVRARADVGALAAFLRSAREHAVTRGQALEVVVDRDAHALVLRRAGREDTAVVLRRRAISPRLRLAADPPAAGVTFFPHGTSSGARFAVAAHGAGPYVIAVDALTGRVSMRQAG
jgi:type II secretory pathway pseudopilin PulG